MKRFLYWMYDSVRLNLGIKRFLKDAFADAKLYIDTEIILKLNRIIEAYITRNIIRHYGADYRWGDEKSQNIEKKTGNLGYGLVHYAFIRNFRPKRILCVGSMYGFIPYMMARACQENGRGHVDFVDAGFDINKKNDRTKHSFGQGFWKNTNLGQHFSYLLDKKFIDTYIMTTKEFHDKYKFEYDYVYLDGDHTYEGGKLDLKLFWPRLKKDGFLCYHDIHFKRILKGIVFGYWKVWEELSLSKRFKIEVSNKYSGLGFVQKKI